MSVEALASGVPCFLPPSLPAEFTIARSLQAPRPLLTLPSSFRSWLICHLLQEALPDSPLRRASRQPDSLSLDQVSHQRPRPEPMALISLLPGHLSWLQTCPTEPGAPCRQGPLCRRAWHRERAFGKWDWLKVSWLCSAGPAPHRQQTALLGQLPIGGKQLSPPPISARAHAQTHFRP